MLVKKCPNCDSDFETYPSVDKKFCGRKCSAEFVKKQTYAKYKCECEVCGGEFLPKRPKEGGRFCSYTCSGIANRKDKVKREGYWYKYVPEHPCATKQGYVAVHRLVMEESLGRFLESDEVVHHINLDRSDNRLDNLALMTDSEHKALHARERERSDKGVYL